MTNDLTVGERIAWYRRRRGLSQEVLAGRVSRTADWLSKIENGRIELDRLSVLRALAGALDVSLADLLAEPSLMDWTQDSGHRTVPALRAVLMDYREVTDVAGSDDPHEPVAVGALEEDVADLWGAYQDARFGYVTHGLLSVIPAGRLAVQAHNGDEYRAASGRLALAYHLAATVLTKLGEADLAWSASSRGTEAARRSENPVVIGSLLRSVTHSLLSTGAYGEAVRLTHDTVEFLAPHMVKAGPTMLSIHGTALLAGSMAAARNEDRSTARDFLQGAEDCARRLGRDENRLWTAFGPTNVAIHRVSTAMELGDVQIAVAMGPGIDTSGVPVERRVRHALEVSRALSSANRRDDALSALLDAESEAPEQIKYHYLSRHLVHTWIRAQRGKPSFQLAGLARRLNVA
ncbi:helix-turn-helix domain-containing protein [Nocardioides speluncae]|uniref:helix-turn-helix domain-containing protein n=1 Tax=Nocardioides speluncae TaxID=2670337 RepID=UPI000D688048|nr:helix-turn-helix transcriptional regulator [Nocardioides speluncae]